MSDTGNCPKSSTHPSAAPLGMGREAEGIRWMRVNDEPFEYAIQQGPHGSEFIKLLSGTCLRRAATGGGEALERLQRKLCEIHDIARDGLAGDVAAWEALQNIEATATSALSLTRPERATPAPFYGAQCPSYPACNGGCGLGCTHEVEKARPEKGWEK